MNVTHRWLAAGSLLLAGTVLAGCGRSSLIGVNGNCPPGAFCLPGPSTDMAGGGGGGGSGGGDGGGVVDFDLGSDGDGGVVGFTSSDMPLGDDAGDGCNVTIPCKDPRCEGKPVCTTPGKEICNNGIDDNDNLLVDCADPQCLNDPACQHLDGGARNDAGMLQCIGPDGSVDCNRPPCNQLPQCLQQSCAVDVDFGAIQQHGSDVTRTFDTRGATREFKTCAFPGGRAVVGRFTLSAVTDVRLDFSQPGGAAHVVTLNRAGFAQFCDQNQLYCLQAGDKATATHTFAALPPGTYYVIVQSYPGTQAATNVRLFTGTGPELICDDGIDNNGNNLVDCADHDCINAPNCTNDECQPDLNLGAIVVGAPAVSADFNTRSMGGDRFHPTCGGNSTGNDYVVRFTLHQTAGVLVSWTEDAGANHVISIFHTPPPGQECDAAQVSCYYPAGISGGLVAFAPKPPGDYVFIFKALTPAQEGLMHISVSSFINRQQEICNNTIDDDNNGLTDCADPACYGVDGCKPAICMPDVDLGDFSWGTQKSVTVDTTSGNNYYTATCAKGNGKNRVIRVNLTQNMGLGYSCTETGSQVLALTQIVNPLDFCDKNPINCADPSLLPFGCNFIMPNLQPGKYDILVEAFAAGQEGKMNLTLAGVKESSIIDCSQPGSCSNPACYTSPYCTGQACVPAKDLGLLPLDGSKQSATVQTAGATSTLAASCVVAPGGGDADVDFQMPGKGDVTLSWAQEGSAVFALYNDNAPLATCDAGPAVSCVSSAAAATGSTTWKALAAGKYHLVIKSDKPGDEGGVVLQLSGVPSL
jgi:hypothetical protein